MPPSLRRLRAGLSIPLALAAACAGDGQSGDSDGPPQVRVDTTAVGIAWEVTGRGPAVVLVHGTNLDRRSWAGVVDALSSDHTVVTYDLRSHGGSIDAGGAWSDLDDLAGVLDAAGLDRVRLVGLSAGAGIALEFAVEHPARVAGLVLVSPSVRGFRPEPGDVPDVFGPLAQALPTGDPDAIGDALVALPTFRVAPTRQPAVDAIVRDNLRLFAVDPNWMRSPDTPPLQRLGEVAAPTAIVVGTEDFPAARRLAERLAGGIPSADLQVIEGAHHLIPIDRPEIVAAAVERLPPP